MKKALILAKINSYSPVALRQLAEVAQVPVVEINVYTVYAIYNKQNKKFYIGQTKDLVERIHLHNKKAFRGYTSCFDGDWTLIYKEECGSRNEALQREKQLKSFRGREFIKKFIPR